MIAIVSGHEFWWEASAGRLVINGNARSPAKADDAYYAPFLQIANCTKLAHGSPDVHEKS
tara:strand:+ start:181 stop:360 length:180 start_codon:yes stop_codon:yes gene_type:complete